MKNTMKRILALAVLCTMMVSVLLNTVSCGKNDEAESQDESKVVEQIEKVFPELQILSAEDSGNVVAVETTYGLFSYPLAFSDLIAINAVNNEESAQLQINAKIDETECVVYTIHYNEEIGMKCGSLKLDNYADVIDVYIEFTDDTNDISEEWVTTFYAVQETFNDVINSMAKDNRFTVVD